MTFDSQRAAVCWEAAAEPLMNGLPRVTESRVKRGRSRPLYTVRVRRQVAVNGYSAPVTNAGSYIGMSAERTFFVKLGGTAGITCPMLMGQFFY